MPEFKGKPPKSGSGQMSRRTEALRPTIALNPAEVAEARRLRRQGHEPVEIAKLLAAPVEEVEKALLQMRMPRPETTRGTLNVTLAAHRFVMSERRGDEPIYRTMDRLLDELLKLRAAAQQPPSPPRRTASRSGSGSGADDAQPPLPLE